MPQSRSGNVLLSVLAAEDRAALLALLEPVELKAQEVLEQPNERVEFAFFPDSGIASVIATDSRGRQLEAGPFGREGMSGLPILLGNDRSPHETRVQNAGPAHRIKADDFRRLLASRPAMHALLLRYVQAFSIQTAHTLMATAQGNVELRLARWILMLHDRHDGDEVTVTHDFMALMLSVRRPGVTITIHELEGKGLIRSTRGRLVIRDRAGLEKFCGSFYGIPEAEYARLIVRS